MTESRGATRRLLVLDDEVDVATTICTMAATASFETDHTGDADVFLEKARDWAPTHVLVDLQLDGRDGIEVIHKLAAMGCKAAVIIISGLDGRILDSSALAATENGLRLIGTLSKPFSRARLLRLLAADPSNGQKGQGSSSSTLLPAVSREQLTEALQAKAFIAHFQPKISCIHRDLVGFECLARWPQPDGGMIPAVEFIRVAEASGLIHELTMQVFDWALANLPDRGSDFKFALNLSAANLSDQAFPGWLLEKCREHGVPPSQIILEVAETDGREDPLKLLEYLTQFRIHGFHLSIDDFGAGYCSLVQLARLPFSELKIDQAFIKSLSSSEESRQIVNAVVGLGNALGLNIVAEGVEEAWALDYLYEVGCHEAQGYFIARPMDHLAATAWTGCSWRSRP